MTIQTREIKIERPTKKEMVKQSFFKVKSYLEAPFLFFIYVNIILYFCFILSLILK